MEDKYLTCPYVSSHQILCYRFNRHLLKCMKNFPKNHLRICDYDWNHHVPHVTYNDHLLTCQAKIDFEKSTVDPATFKFLPRNPQEDEPLDEDWGLDPADGTYDPKITGKKSGIIGPVKPTKPDHGEGSQSSNKVESSNYVTPVEETKPPAADNSNGFSAHNLAEQGGRFVGGQRFPSTSYRPAAPPVLLPQNSSSVVEKRPIDTIDLNAAMSGIVMGARPARPLIPPNETGRGRGMYKDRLRTAIPLASDPAQRPTLNGSGRGIYQDSQRPAVPLSSGPGKRPEENSAIAKPTQMSRGRGIYMDKAVQ